MIPDQWTRSTLAELCELVKGETAIQKARPGPYPLVTTGEERKSADHFQFNIEAVCVPMISSTGHGHASLKRVHYQSGKFALGNLLTALAVRQPSRLLPRFLALYLTYFKDQLLVPLMVGTANMSLTMKRLGTVVVHIPPLKDQERILCTLGEAHEVFASGSWLTAEPPSWFRRSSMRRSAGRQPLLSLCKDSPIFRTLLQASPRDDA